MEVIPAQHNIAVTSLEERKATFSVAPPPFPAAAPRCLPAQKGEQFDANIHLQIEPPALVKDLFFKDVAYPYSGEQRSMRGNLAYTTPFRILSDEGVKAARRALEADEAVLARSNPRACRYVRGLGYASNFHRGLALDPTVTALLSDIAREPLSIHSMPMNISHTNVGFQSDGSRPVDKWHTDSVDFVMVIILSDLTDMQGGSLRVLQMADATGATFARLAVEGVPEELVEAVRYTGAGYCVLMQGSKILHTVDAVLRCREPRLSLVNSYMSLRPFSEDKTKYATFTEAGFGDPAEVAALEFSRHKAWRAMGKLQFLIQQVEFGTATSDLIQLLEEAAKDCQQGASLLRGEANDNALWVEDKKQQQQLQQQKEYDHSNSSEGATNSIAGTSCDGSSSSSDSECSCADAEVGGSDNSGRKRQRL